MKKLFSFVLVLLIMIGTTTIYAQSISTNKAIDIGVRFFEQVTNNSPRYAPARTIGENMATARALQYSNRECMYVVSMPDSGWVLVSGDERVVPILAVSYDGSFPAEEDMPPAMRDLLTDYANEIIFIQDSLSDSQSHPQWVALENNNYTAQTLDTEIGSDIYTPGDKLLERPGRGEVIWDQGTWNGYASNGTNCEYAYNKFCPDWYSTSSCNRTYVGCGAVAMGLIMWYWQWPHAAFIPIDVKMDGTPNDTTKLQLYDWTLMPNALTPSTSMEKVDAVASFLLDCGYAIKTEYRSDGSYSYLSDIMAAFSDIFSYELTYNRKANYPLTWETELREEIDAGRPVLYYGNNTNGGHFFVADGYDANDNSRFHINWGWGGRKNDYFVLGNLCPPGHNYNNNQAALWGIQPAPNCDPHNTDDTYYATNGALIVNASIESGEVAAYYSGTSVTLLPGFHAKLGSKVHIAIRDFPCDGIAPVSLRAPQQHQGGGEEGVESTYEDIIISEMTISPNPVQDILQITSSEPIETVAIYTLSGDRVLQATTTQVDVSNLKEGMYIVRATSQAGIHYTAKIVKQ